MEHGKVRDKGMRKQKNEWGDRRIYNKGEEEASLKFL